MKLILASQSPARKKLLEQLQITFIVAPSHVDETPFPNETPKALVERLTLAKAQKCAEKNPHCLIIACDQILTIEQQILGKPETHENAAKMLMQCSGKSVISYTGLGLLNTESKNWQFVIEPFTVHYRKFPQSAVENYLKKDPAYQCAGALRVESLGIALIEKLEGDDYNALIGLPLIKLCEMLENENIQPLT